MFSHGGDSWDIEHAVQPNARSGDRLVAELGRIRGRVPWRAVMPGAVLSAILIVVAGFALGLIFSGMFAGIYAALGGPIALMLWVNLVGQSVMLGCELTRQYWLLLADGQRTIAAMSGTAA